jgi:glycosyltransferase involved in cell wall biosynthesis
VTDPVVSVVIPTFRREAVLLEAIQSALNAGDMPLEILVLDDSAEGSAASHVGGLADERVQYVHRSKPSGGVPAIVRNEGLAMARGRYVHFLDDDDVLERGALAALVGALEKAPKAGVAMGTVVPFGDDEDLLAYQRQYFTAAADRLRAARSQMQLVSGMLFESTPLVNSSCMIRKTCAVAIGGYAPDIPLCEDVDFFMRAIRHSGFVFIDRPVVRYRTGEPSLMQTLGGYTPLFIGSYRTIHQRYRQQHGAVEFFLLKLMAFWRRHTRSLLAGTRKASPLLDPCE